MAKNIDFMGAIFPDVPSVKLPQQGGGLVAFDDTTDATATADKILSGYTAYAGGQKLTGTASGGITPSGTMSITSNGTYDVTQYASANVNVSGGGGIGTLLHTENLGLIQYSSTSAGSLGRSITVSNIDDYDVLLLAISTNNITANTTHICTITPILLHTNGRPSPDYIGAKQAASVSTSHLNIRTSNTATIQIESYQSAYGLYPLSLTVSDGTITMPLYARYSSTSTGTIDNDYTARVYGVKLFELL